MSVDDTADPWVDAVTVQRKMAKRFRFRLDVVERVRRQVHDKQRRVVAEAIRAVGRMEDHVASLNEELRRSVVEQVSEQSRATLDVVLVRSQEFHRGWLHRQMTGAQLELGRRERELASKRDGLAEATKQLRVIEKLREKQRRRYVTEVKREEQLVNDEMAVTRFLRESAEAARGRAN